MNLVDDLKALADELSSRVRRLAAGERLIVGIAGIPGAGKSTVSEILVNGVNKQFTPEHPAIVVPMDGFHYSNAVLKEMGLLELKGVPDSFDAAGFLALIKELRANTFASIPAPLFDRSIEASINGGIVITPEHRLCLVEGNYLLLQKSPWDQLKKYFDEIWFLDVPIDTVVPRLVERHLLQRTPAEAKIKMESTDIPNAKLILETKIYADRSVALTNASEPLNSL